MRRLTQISAQTNCTTSWDSMNGSKTVRHCTTCRKDAYNLSAMTEPEASALLAVHEDRCIRYLYRPDGTIVTSRCPQPSHEHR